MEYTLIQNPALNSSACFVVGLFSDAPLPNVLQTLDKTHQGLISKLSKRAKLPGDLVWQAELDGHSLVLIQCGVEKDWTQTVLRKRLDELLDFLIKQRLLSATISLPLIKDTDPSRQLERMILQIDNKQYQFLHYKKKNPSAHALKSLAIDLPGASDEALVTAKAICAGIHLTRDLAKQKNWLLHISRLVAK
jgi:leucyl aminopeptidase